MNFVSSYSGGKDSILALYRAIKKGHTPKFLLTTFNKNNGKSLFHHVPLYFLEEVSRSVDIPLVLADMTDCDYSLKFEETLLSLKDKDVKMCVFGDIDIDEHYKWGDNRCQNTGLKSLFPLWKENRQTVVHDFIELGFKSIITVVDSKRLNPKFLGRILTIDLLNEIEADGADMCGENGEYHTFTFDGPIFNYPIPYKLGVIDEQNGFLRIELTQN